MPFGEKLECLISKSQMKNVHEKLIVITGRERLIRSHSSARFCFELSGNSMIFLCQTPIPFFLFLLCSLSFVFSLFSLCILKAGKTENELIKGQHRRRL